ncbi:uncharacterized protein LOC135104966 isoform X2 [Scylla paramamosain]|uniref:uncharacterized protein LOC135104966 isoform X2 n=1 Tax=Scylla paramamosain TaxID=85552 RepID=UPI003083DB98
MVAIIVIFPIHPGVKRAAGRVGGVPRALHHPVLHGLDGAPLPALPRLPLLLQEGQGLTQGLPQNHRTELQGPRHHFHPVSRVPSAWPSPLPRCHSLKSATTCQGGQSRLPAEAFCVLTISLHRCCSLVLLHPHTRPGLTSQVEDITHLQEFS